MSSSGFNVIRRHSSDATGIRIKELTQELAKQRSELSGSQLETDDVRSQGRMDHSTIKLNDERLKFIDLRPIDFNVNYEFPTEPDFNFLKVWFMLDHLGSRMRDMSGFGNDAIIQGHPTLRRANLLLGFDNIQTTGGTPAMLFNSGTDVVSQTDGEYIWIPDNPSIQFTQYAAGFSIAFRFNCLNFNQHFNPLINFTSSRRFAAKTDNATNGWNLLVYSSNTAGTQGGVEFEIIHNNVQYARRTSGYAADTWYQVVVTYNPNAGSTAADRIKIYTAGSENSISSTFGSILPTHTNLRIGARSADTGFFYGYIHDFRLYMGKVLTQAEITNWNQNEITIDNIPKGQAFLLQHAMFGWTQSNHRHRYGVGGYIIKLKTHKFHVTNKVTRTRTHKYNKLAIVLRTKTHKFNVVKQALKTKIHRYVLTGKVTRPKTHKFNITSKMAIPAVKTHKFNILTAVPTITKTHKYNIVTPVTKTKTHKYNMGGKIPTVVKTHKYNIIGKITRTKTHRYAIGGLQTQYIRFIKSTGSNGTTQDVTFNAPPQAIIVWTDGSSSDNIYSDHYALSYGFSDGTTHACVTGLAVDNAATSDTFSGHKTDKVIAFASTAGVVGFEASVAFSGNTATFTWSTNDAIARYIHCMAIWGVNAVEVKNFSAGTTATGNFSYAFNNSSLVPRFINTITRDSNTASWGVAFGNSTTIGAGISSSKQFAIADMSVDALATMEAKTVYSTTNTLLHYDDDTGTALNASASFSSASAGSLELNWTDAPGSAYAFSVLAIDSASIDVGVITQPNGVTGAQVTNTDTNVGQVKGLMMFTNSQTSASLAAVSSLTVGAASGTGASDQGLISIRDNDAAATSITVRSQRTGAITRTFTAAATATSSTTTTEAAVSALGTNQFTLNWTAADANTRKYHYVAFGTG